MHIQGGYGKKALEKNIAEYIDFGYTEEEAKRISKQIARKFFVKAKPDQPIPEYLQEDNNV